MCEPAKRARYSLDPDVEIEVEDAVIPLHSFPLMSASPVFRRMLESGMSESQTGRIRLLDKTEQELRLVLPWLRMEEPKPKVLQADLQTRLRFAREYEIKTLQDACEEYLLKQRSDLVPALQLAVEFGLSRRIHQCVESISRDLPTHISALEAVIDDQAVMNLLWPTLFAALKLPEPEPLPAGPCLRQLWPIVAKAIECNDCLLTGQMSIEVKTVSGRMIPFRVKPDHTIYELKLMIQDEEGIPPEEQRIIVKGRQGANHKSLKELEVHHKDTVYLS